MGSVILTVKRPDEATPAHALALYHRGVKVTEMARMWDIQRSYVYYLLHRAGWKAGTRPNKGNKP